MGYTPVPAVIAGDMIDEVFIMTYWVDNMAAQAPDVFSAKGQMIIGSGVDAMGVLNVGANETVLFADSSQALGVKWAAIAQKRTVLGKSSSQNITSGATAAITWDVETKDEEGLHSTSVNTDRLTFVTSGLYLLVCMPYATTTGNFYLSVIKNGSTTLSKSYCFGSSAGSHHVIALLIDATAGDYISLSLQEISAVTQVLTSSSQLFIARLGG